MTALPATTPAAAEDLTDLIDGGHLVLIGFPTEPTDQAVLAATDALDPKPTTLHRVEDPATARELLERWPVRVLALGPQLDSATRADFLETLRPEHRHLQPAIVVLGDCDEAVLQHLVQDDLLFFTTAAPLGEAQIVELLAAGFAHARSQMRLDLAALGRSRDPRVVLDRKLFSTAETMADLTAVDAFEDPLFEALDEVLEVAGGRLWLYDPLDHSLTAATGEGLEVLAVAGLTSFAARTGRTVASDHAATDPRFDFEADDGVEGPLMAVPVLGPESRVLAVLTLWRDPGHPAWTPEERQVAERFAAHLAPHLVTRLPRPFASHQHRLSQETRDTQLFRRQALAANERDFTDRGRVLRNDPGWARWTWGVLAAGFLAALVLGLLGSVHEYAGGPAFVRIGQRVDVAAQAEGSVIGIEVAPGARVTSGDPLARLYGVAEAAEISNLEDEFDHLLRRRLASPGDSATEQSLIATRTALERARARLAQRVVRAPIDGVVGDVRVRPGQHLSAGELLLSVIADQEVRSVVGLIPGHFGPQLAVGQRLRLTLVGYPDLSFHLDVTAVGEEVISPFEARQALGGSIADTVAVAGPVVLVEGRLADSVFRDGDREWRYRDGMEGVMEIRVRSRPILFHLIPGLDRVFRSRDG